MLDKRERFAHTYEDFFSGELLSLGLSVWPAGQPDDQQPHSEDEVYFVLEGRGCIQVGEEDDTVEHGSIVFVPSGVPHHFHDIEEELKVLVFWAPPHHSRAKVRM
jgi:mannose-6-phosphate isomerase-like protein (cupin superfamily)